MPIKVSCQCGKKLTAKDALAGKRVKCPGCGAPLQVPPAPTTAGGDGISQLLDDVGLRAGVVRCPGCGAEMAEEAVLCVMCGFDLRRGHRLKTRIGSAVELDDEDLGDLPYHGVERLDEAEREIARSKRQDEILMKGVPWWMILLAFLGVVGFSVGMIMMPEEQVMTNSGYVLITAGSLLVFYFTLRLVIEGFKQSVLTGLVMLFFPPFLLYYVVSRWDRVGILFFFIAAGGAMIGAGIFMLQVLAPVFENTGSREGSDGFSLRLWRNRSVAVSCADLPTLQTFGQVHSVGSAVYHQMPR